MKHIYFQITTLLLLTQAINAQIITVKQDSTGDYIHIQDAVDAANNGDTILVWPGTYCENVAIEDKNLILGSLTITTGDETYINQTIINGNHSGSCIKLNECPDTCEVNGFTLTNGSGTYHGAYSGGGLSVDVSNTQVINCKIINNRVTGRGGGIYLKESYALCKNTNISYNHAYNTGGGVHILNGTLILDSIRKCNIYLNYAATGTDIYKLGDESPPLEVIVDTFTVAEPNHYYLFSDADSDFPAEDITFNINSGKIQVSNENLFVSPSGSNSNSGLSPEESLKDIYFALLKMASDSVSPDTIHIAYGTYSPSAGEKFPLSLKKNVSIKGENRDSTILDAEDEIYLLHGPLFTNNYQVSNLTIRRGNGDINSYYNRGAAIILANKNIAFENILVKENIGSIVGGIHTIGCSNIVFKNVDFSNNQGGKALRLIYSYSEPAWDTAYLESCRFIENQPDYTDPEYGFGGGVSVFSSLSSNPANITAFITNCLFENNHSKDNPFGMGTISLTAGRGSNVFLTNCTMADNTTENTQGANIGQVNNSNIHIYNSIIYNPDSPAEIYMFTTPDAGDNNLFIQNSLFYGGQENIRVLSDGNNIFYDNETNIDTDPFFLNKWEHPYQINTGSPCIDAGTLNLPDFIQLPETDLAGNPRIVGDSIDMGAYEWNPTVGIDKYQYQPIKNDKPKLMSAAPNPFAWETTISAKWDFTGNVQIEIYNNAGLRVKVLKSGRSGGKGSIQTKWNGKDENGNILPTGIYHIVMFWDGKEVEGLKVVKK